MTVTEMRENLRSTGAITGQLRMVPLIHILIFRFKVDWHVLVNAPQGDNRAEIEAAQKKLDDVQAALKASEQRAAESKEAVKQAQVREAEAHTAKQELEVRKKTLTIYLSIYLIHPSIHPICPSLCFLWLASYR